VSGGELITEQMLIMDMINWGIIGCGNVTEIKSGPAFNKVPGSKLVAVMRRDAIKAKDYAERHGVPRWYSHAQELIEDPEVNAVYIATPPRYHEEFALRSIAEGKPVYLEKPMAMDAVSASRIVEAAVKKGVKLTIAHYRRAQESFLYIKELLAQKKIGEPRLVNLRFFEPHQSALVAQTEEAWRLDPAISGGGLFHDLAPHQLDLMVYFFGRPLEAAGRSLNSAGYYKADDTVSGQIVFERGILFNGCWSFTAPPVDSCDECTILGAEGTIRFSIFRKQPVVLTTPAGTETDWFDLPAHVQQPMIEKTVRYFAGRGPNPCSAAEGQASMELIDAFTTRPWRASNTNT
jgi:predicted dehydrogenase